jgi:hypothetical protein
MAVELPAIRNSGSGQNPAARRREVLLLVDGWNPEYCGARPQFQDDSGTASDLKRNFGAW